jgi:mono/diheme cytochrome c family protein
MKRSIILSTVAFAILLSSCGGSSESNTSSSTESTSDQSASSATTSENPSYDPNRGEGKFTSVDLGAGLDAKLAESGESVYGVKCSSCHKTSSEKLVGPGWEGVTKRRKPEWIMNFITNPDPMIDKDPELQAQLELCLVRMPNQNVTDQEAREILEFMRKVDGVK